jgi:DNA processing protein
MFSKLTTYEALFLLSQFSGLSPKNLREFLLLNNDNQRVVDFLIRRDTIKYSSVYKINPLDKTKCLKALEIYRKQEAMGVKTISFLDKEYPFNSNKMSDAPVLIYRTGDAPASDRRLPLLAIVGTRKMTAYGKAQIDEFFQIAHEPNFEVISGLAYGIDSYSQSVASKSGFTVHSVLAHGLDHTYPKSHITLRKGLEQKGFTFSEYPIQSPAHKGRFLERNRLIAGMADVVWVVESAERGGSLVTANFAKDYNSHLVASPGDIHKETSQGCNRLIANHSAVLYERPETIATHLGVHFPLRKSLSKKLPKDAKTLKIYELLKFHHKLYPSQIIQLSGLEKDTVLELLLQMHLEDQVIHNPDNSYSI